MNRAFVAVSVGIIWILNLASIAAAAAHGAAALSAAARGAGGRGDPARADAAARRSAAQPSPIKVAPYGILYFNLFDNSGGTNNGDVPLWALAGPGNLSASGRQSRFGFRVTGAHGRQGETERRRRSGFLRRISRDRHRRQHGRAAAAAGERAPRLDRSVGRRRTGLDDVRAGQSRVALRGGHSVDGGVRQRMVAAAAGARRMARGADAAAGRGAGAEHGRLLLGVLLSARRPARCRRCRSCRAARRSRRRTGWDQEAGDDRHFGPLRPIARVDGAIDRELDSRGVAVDWSLAFAPRVTLSGEAFAGRNLAAFQAGVFQGINPDAAIGTATGSIDDGPRAIRTRGGWAQLAVAVHPVLNVQATYGLDDPRDDTLASITRRDWRRRNLAYAIGFVHKLSPQFSWSLEERRIITHLALTGRRTTNHLNLATTFSF